MKSLVGLFVQGRTRYKEIDLFRRNRLFRDSFGFAYVPARETLRLYLERMVPEQVQGRGRMCHDRSAEARGVDTDPHLNPVVPSGRRLPSGKFAVNGMILQIAMVAFNILRFLGQSVLDMEELPYQTEVTRKRLRKVIDDLIRIAVKLVSHAHRQIIKLWDRDPWLWCFRKPLRDLQSVVEPNREHPGFNVRGVPSS
jgi:hypothetical protein